MSAYIEETAPFKRAKDPERLPEVATILHDCAEAIRIASVCLWPFLPGKVEEAWRRLGCEEYVGVLADRGRGRFDEWTRWGGLEGGTPIAQGDPLFPRHRVG